MDIFKEMLIGILISIKSVIRNNYKYALFTVVTLAFFIGFIFLVKYLDKYNENISKIIGIIILIIFGGAISVAILYGIYTNLKERWGYAKRATETHESISSLLTSKGFRLEKIFRNTYRSHHAIRYLYYNGTFSVIASNRGIEVWIGRSLIVKPGRIYTRMRVKEFELLMDALAEPKKLPLCMNIEWAKPLVEEFMKGQ